MALKLVWSNPRRLPEQKARVRQIMKDEFGSLYIASYDDGDEEFELMTGREGEPASLQNVEQPESA